MLSYLILIKSFYTVYCTVETKNPVIIKKTLKELYSKLYLLDLREKTKQICVQYVQNL